MKRATNKCNDDDFHADKLTDDYQYSERKEGRWGGWNEERKKKQVARISLCRDVW